MRAGWLGAAAALLAAVPLQAAPPRADALPPAVRTALLEAGLPATALHAAALPLDGGAAARRRGWSHQGEAAVAPGSAMKLVTSIVALDRLGADARGGTEVLATSPPDADGVLHGDLVLRGGGDPELGVPQLWALLAELRAAGVREVRGDLLLDRTRWRPARADLGAAPFDAAPEAAYNVIPDALHLAGGLLSLRIEAAPDAGAADRSGSTAATTVTGIAAPAATAAAAPADAADPATTATVRAAAVPVLDGLTVVSRQTAVDAPCGAWRDGWQPPRVRSDGAQTIVELHGTFPRGCVQRTALQLLDRTALAGHLFATLWRQLGGAWHGRVREAAAPPGALELARRQARPWREVMRTVNKQSDNALARMLFLALGEPAMAARPGVDTAVLAAEAVERWFVEHGIDVQGLVIDNGSGLSRRERITPLQLALALRVAHRAPWAADLLATLPLAGVDGTLRQRLRDGPAAGRARLKTGLLSNAVALAGYLDDPEGRRWAVVAVVHHEQAAARGRPVLDALIDHWARHGFAATRGWAGVGPQGQGP